MRQPLPPGWAWCRTCGRIPAVPPAAVCTQCLSDDGAMVVVDPVNQPVYRIDVAHEGIYAPAHMSGYLNVAAATQGCVPLMGRLYVHVICPEFLGDVVAVGGLVLGALDGVAYNNPQQVVDLCVVVGWDHRWRIVVGPVERGDQLG